MSYRARLVYYVINLYHACVVLRNIAFTQRFKKGGLCHYLIHIFFTNYVNTNDVTQMYVCIYVCVYVYMYVCMYACMYVCMHACIYVCMYTNKFHIM